MIFTALNFLCDNCVISKYDPQSSSHYTSVANPFGTFPNFYKAFIFGAEQKQFFTDFVCITLK